MRHRCEHCGQRYSIPDEKVVGKVLKVRCKVCQGVMAVMGPRADFNAKRDARPPTLTGIQPYRPSQKQLPSSGGRVWWCGIGGKPHGPFAESELDRLITRGDVHARTRLWRSGMEEWERICESPRLSWVYEKVIERHTEDSYLLEERDPTLVFDRAALVGDEGGYFPNPTLKSGWLILDEKTQHHLETCALQAGWFKMGLDAYQSEEVPMVVAASSRPTPWMAGAVGMIGMLVIAVSVQFMAPRPLTKPDVERPSLEEKAAGEGHLPNVVAQMSLRIPSLEE